MKTKYYYGLDGSIVDNQLVDLFNLGTMDMVYSRERRNNVFNFVGFMFCGENVLVVFPKHYCSESRIKILNTSNIECSKDIKLLYSVIRKFHNENDSKATARKYIGPDNNYDSDYPLDAFYNIYNYFQKYGLYKQPSTKIVKGNGGKYSWKDILRKSDKIISNDNLIFWPLYVKKKNNSDVFITECMIFVIDYTLNIVHNFFSMKGTGRPESKFDFINNVDFVIKELKKQQNIVFKDVNKKLIMNLIIFFEEIKFKKFNGGRLRIKIDYFNVIWQQMVHSYLNNHFVCFDNIQNQIIFDESKSQSQYKFVEKNFNDFDISDNSFSITVDHFLKTDTEVFIFDSKYYRDIPGLNYKQFSYREILRYKFSSVDIYNVLILPGEEYSKIHFLLTPSYSGPRNDGCKIVEQYLEPQRIMIDYVKN